MKLLKDIITESDGETNCPARIYTLAGVLAHFFYMGYALMKGLPFDIESWSKAFTLTLGGGMAAIWAKSKGSPEI